VAAVTAGIRRREVAASVAGAVLTVLAVAAPAPAGAAATPPASIREPSSSAVLDHELARRGRPKTPAPLDPSSAFVYRKGRFTALDRLPAGVIAAHSGINGRGQVTGIYFDPDAFADPNGEPRARSRASQARGGDRSSLDLPFPFLHAVRGINDRGQIVGYYDNTADRADGGGFLRNRNGEIDRIVVPGATYTSPWGINNRAVVVGNYTRADGTLGGFLRTGDGELTLIDAPGASDTTPNDINDRGAAVGAFFDAGTALNPDGTVPPGAVHGFVWQRGRFTKLDVPGSIFTQPFGINDRGQISGGYYDEGGGQHGFLLSRGEYETLDAPGRANTIAIDINDRGEIVIPDPNTSLLPVAVP
jgi:hypothetical protein